MPPLPLVSRGDHREEPEVSTQDTQAATGPTACTPSSGINRVGTHTRRFPDASHSGVQPLPALLMFARPREPLQVIRT